MIRDLAVAMDDNQVSIAEGGRSGTPRGPPSEGFYDAKTMFLLLLRLDER